MSAPLHFDDAEQGRRLLDALSGIVTGLPSMATGIASTSTIAERSQA